MSEDIRHHQGIPGSTACVGSAYTKPPPHPLPNSTPAIVRVHVRARGGVHTHGACNLLFKQKVHRMRVQLSGNQEDMLYAGVGHAKAPTIHALSHNSLIVKGRSPEGQAIADHLVEFPIKDNTPINPDFPDEGILLQRIDFPYTNNVAEYEACILGLQAAIDFKVKELKVFGDSMLIIFQTLGQWKTKDTKLVPYHEYLERLTENFEDISFTYTPCVKNQFADVLATLASMVSITRENLIEPLEIEIAKGPTHCNAIEATEAKPWYEDMMNFLRTGQYPPFADRHDRKTLRHLAIHYFLSGEILYRRSFDSMLLRCIDEHEA
ncbi:hypothetical protein CRG98_023203 [Punica granatum]|uniref:RNase H type-1 domain-containing protein n=1 Tax=Punica granatum TaxID=22663 RepID=A0A2I0JKD3_PUNGR|nr:hypothetical protein CRG98_023203 [Punica granatum]